MSPNRLSNVAGEAIAMTAVSDVKWWGRVWLPILFAVTGRVPALTKTLRGLQFIHFAYWTIIDGRLLFVSNFNGGWREYIEAFSRQLTRGMTFFWGSSRGFPGPLPVEPFLAYIDEHEYGAETYYSAYPQANTADVEAALARTGHRPSEQVSSFTSLMPNGVMPAVSRESFEGTGAHFARFVILPEGLLFTAVHDGTRDEFVDRLVTAGIVVDRGALLTGEIKPGLFYAAYHATVQEVRDALEQLPPDDEEWTGDVPGERLRILQLLRFLMGKQGAERCQHADEIGTVDAVVIPLPERPEWCKAGVLARHGEYPCVVRYSRQDGVIGAALIFGREDQTDVTAIDADAFFFRDPAQVLESQEKRQGRLGLARFFFPAPLPWRWRLRGLHHAIKARRRYPWQCRVQQPVDVRLRGLVAFRHGGAVLQWALVPRYPKIGAARGASHSEALAESIRRSPIEYDLCGQVWVDAKRTPIDNPTREWPERLTPFVPLARVVLTMGQVPRKARPEERVTLRGGVGPMGDARHEVYPALQEKRLEL